jgi:hypothetical protein
VDFFPLPRPPLLPSYAATFSHFQTLLHKLKRSRKEEIILARDSLVIPLIILSNDEQTRT